MVYTKPFALIIIPLALLLLLLPAAQGQAEPPSNSTKPVLYESCAWYGPPNITENPPPENNYRVWLNSFDMSLGKQPISHNLTANIDKLLPGGRAVTQFWFAMTGNTSTTNVDLCSLTRGGCPIQPGNFTVSFDLYIDYFTEIQFSMFAENGELLLCVYFEESEPGFGMMPVLTHLRQSHINPKESS